MMKCLIYLFFHCVSVCIVYDKKWGYVSFIRLKGNYNLRKANDSLLSRHNIILEQIIERGRTSERRSIGLYRTMLQCTQHTHGRCLTPDVSNAAVFPTLCQRQQPHRISEMSVGHGPQRCKVHR